MSDRTNVTARFDIREMRDWIADCEWADPVDVHELSDRDVVRAVERHYDGGVDQFVADGGAA